MIVGVDTHTHVHVAVAIDTWGIRLDDRSCAAAADGYQQLITWAERHGRIAAFGIEGLSRRHGVTAAKLSQWRGEFLAGGEARLKHRETPIEDEDTRRLKSVVADLATDKALLVEKIRHLEAGRPLGWWRSKR